MHSNERCDPGRSGTITDQEGQHHIKNLGVSLKSRSSQSVLLGAEGPEGERGRASPCYWGTENE